jgi:hypothetical protein
VPCEADHPDASEDLNALRRRATWDRIARRWIMSELGRARLAYDLRKFNETRSD